MASSTSARPAAARRVALIAVGLLVVGGFVPMLGLTQASFGATATATASLTVRSACTGDPAGYASNLIPSDAALRWSFSGALPDTATAHPAGPDAAAPPALTPAGTGLLTCDPAELAIPRGTPGSLTLAAGAAGSGLTATAPTTLGDAFTVLFWTSIAAGSDGELASLASAGGELVLTVAPDATLTLVAPGGAPAVLTSPSLADGAAHLVSIVASGGTLTLTVDGEGPEQVTTGWTPGPATLTIGARDGAQTSSGAVVDEVTLLTGATSTSVLRGLVAADRWWTPGPVAATTAAP